MFGVILSIGGVLVMLSLWALAWSLWKQAGLARHDLREPHPRAAWQNEPTAERRPPASPPDWLFADTGIRDRSGVAPKPGSTALVELTEVLDDEPILETAPKTQLFPPPRA